MQHFFPSPFLTLGNTYYFFLTRTTAKTAPCPATPQLVLWFAPPTTTKVHPPEPSLPPVMYHFPSAETSPTFNPIIPTTKRHRLGFLSFFFANQPPGVWHADAEGMAIYFRDDAADHFFLPSATKILIVDITSRIFVLSWSLVVHAFQFPAGPAAVSQTVFSPD